MLLILSILIPLCAGVLIWLVRGRESRIHWAIATGASFLTWILAIIMGTTLPASLQFSIWQPELIFPTPLEFRMDEISWLLVYGCATVILSVFLSEAVRPSIAKARTSAVMLIFTALCFIALYAGNLLTIILAWTLFDLGTLVFLISVQDDPGDIRPTISRIALDFTGIVLIISAGIVIASEGRPIVLGVEPLPALATMLLLAAVVVRLGLMPLHFSLPPVPDVRRGMGTLIRLFPPVVALSLASRVFDLGIPASLLPVLALLGILGFMVGGIRWLFEFEPLSARPFFVLTLSGLGLFTASIFPSGASGITAAAVLILLVGTVISLTEIHLPTHRIWPFISMFILFGLPIAPGGILSGLIGFGLLEGDFRLISILGILGMTLLGLGSIKVFMQEVIPWAEGESRVRTIYTLGLALPVFVAIGLRIRDYTSITLVEIVVFLITLGFSALTYLLLRRAPTERVLDVQEKLNLIDLSPIYDSIGRVIGSILRAIRSIGGIFEGEGAMLWIFVIVIILIIALA